MSQKLPVDGFKCIENISQFNKIFIKNYNQDSNIEHFLKIDVKIYKQLHKLPNDLQFLPEWRKIEKRENFFEACMIKENRLHI